jgi:hypothetical protein
VTGVYARRNRLIIGKVSLGLLLALVFAVNPVTVQEALAAPLPAPTFSQSPVTVGDDRQIRLPITITPLTAPFHGTVQVLLQFQDVHGQDMGDPVRWTTADFVYANVYEVTMQVVYEVPAGLAIGTRLRPSSAGPPEIVGGTMQLVVYLKAIHAAAVPTTPVVPPKPGVVAGLVTEEIKSASGGTVALADESVQVTFPPGATHDDVIVTIAPMTEVVQPTVGMVMIANRIFQITVEDKSGNQVRDFDRDLILTFTFTEEDLKGQEVSSSDLRIFYWDEVATAWIAIPSTVDLATGTVTGTTNHLTIYALMVKPGMPTMPDIKAHWAESHILRLASLGVTNGYEDGTFRPELAVTREEFAKMVILAAGLKPEVAPALTFSDAGEISEWARGYVAAGVKTGIIIGLEGNRFGPAEPLTRAQAVTMIVRALKVQTQATSTTFADDTEIPLWTVGSVQVAVEKGIVNGFEDNTFRPDLNATRCEAAKMLSQFTVVR